MTPALLEQALSVFGKGMATVNGVICSMAYACPTRDWLVTTFAPAVKEDLKLWGADTYVLTRNDCTDFSLYTMALGRLDHNKNNSNQTALAIGTIDYLHDNGDGLPTGHRTNIVIVLENGVYVPVFFEPQYAAKGINPIMELSDSEKDSVRAYYI